MFVCALCIDVKNKNGRRSCNFALCCPQQSCINALLFHHGALNPLLPLSLTHTLSLLSSPPLDPFPILLPGAHYQR